MWLLTRVWLIMAVALLGSGAAGSRCAAGPFDDAGRPASRVVLSWDAEPPVEVFESAMLNRVVGVGGVVAGGDLRRLAVLSRRAEEVGWPRETEVLGYAHVSLGARVVTYRVGVTPDGLALFGSVGVDGAARANYAMDATACGSVVAPLRGFGGSLDEPPGLPLGEVTGVPTPYRHAPIVLDDTTIRERLNGGRKTNLPETARVLADEQLHVRLPAGYSPREPAGLLVWIPAARDGKPPTVFEQAADALNLVMVGADETGNVRVSTDRYQIALDQVATARRLLHLDPERVYVTGISGGGRISSALAVCFPDIFTGAVPIVGLNCYEHVPLGDGRFVPLGFRRPSADLWRLLREHRIAPVTGPLDFNHREMVNAVRIYQGDGLDVRLFEYEDMAHTLPTAERFAEALGWVDARVRERREEAAEEAGELLEAYLQRFDELRVTSDVQRRLLERITVVAPWSAPAWRACELLGLVEAEPASGDS